MLNKKRRASMKGKKCLFKKIFDKHINSNNRTRNLCYVLYIILIFNFCPSSNVFIAGRKVPYQTAYSQGGTCNRM